VTTTYYARAIENLFGGSTATEGRESDFLSDDFKISLHTATYTPNLDTHETTADVTDEIAGAGYTAGGLSLSAKTITYTAADSWATTWAAATAYALGDVVRPVSGNGHLFRCIVAGTSHATTEPTWPTVSGQTIADNTVTWAEAGRGITMVDADDPQWVSSTFTSRYGVVYNNTAADKPLFTLVDFTSNRVMNGGTFTIQLSSLGLFHFFTPV